MKRPLVFAIALVVSSSWALASGCGGHVVEGGDDGGGAGDAIATHDATPGVDSAPVVDCTALKAKVDALRTQAQTCCPFCNSLQCGVAVADVCCSISITAPTAPEFSAAVAQYKASCPSACPAIPCPPAPSGVCKPLDPQNPSSRGLCQ